MPQAQIQPASTGTAPPAMVDSDDPLLTLILQSLDDDQAQDLVTIDLEGKSSIADFMVIASGRSTRQVAAMAQKLGERLKHGGFGNPRIEGLPAADWVLVDAGGVIVHLFRPEVRRTVRRGLTAASDCQELPGARATGPMREELARKAPRCVACLPGHRLTDAAAHHRPREDRPLARSRAA